MHCMKQFLVGSRGIETKHCIYPTVGAERHVTIVDPFCNLIEWKFLETIKAAANPRLRQ